MEADVRLFVPHPRLVEILGRPSQAGSVSFFKPVDLELVPGEKLFGEGGGDWREIAISVDTYANATMYTMGFKEAADALVVRGLETRMQDFVLMPALYLYRHALELVLKDLIYLGQEMRGEQRHVWVTHKLAALWSPARAALEEGFPNDDPATLDAMEALVLELGSIDAGGELFRYSHGKDGVRWELPPQLARVDLAHVSHRMHKLLSLLAGGIDGLSELLAAGPGPEDY